MIVREQMARLSRSVSKANASLVPATVQQSGLATPKMIRNLNTLFGGRPVLPPKTDVNTLSAGYYVASSDAVGVPDTTNESYPAEWFIDVVQHSNGDKLIRITQVGTGRSFKKVIPHVSDDMNYPRVWVREYAEAILWAGNAPIQANLVLTLTDDTKNYNGLIIHYAMGDNYGTVRAEMTTSTTQTVPSTFAITLNNVSNTVGDATVEFIEIGFKAIKNQILVANGKDVIADLARGTARLEPDLTRVAIKEIMGIR